MGKIFFLLLVPFFLFANKSILILDSYHKGYEFSDRIIQGMEDILYLNTQVDVNILYMDSKRVTSVEYFENLKKLYKVQLKDRKYDLIVAVDRFAYDFVLDAYDEFLTTEPILVVGIEEFSKQKAQAYNVENKVSALIEKRDLKNNVKTISRLIPGLKKLYIINDKSINATHTEPLIYEIMNRFNQSYEIIYLKEDHLDNLKSQFSQYEENSAALFIRFYKNSNGELNKNQEIADFIKEAKIPIFVTDSIFSHSGATGGKIVDLREFGQEAANMAFNILYNDVHSIEEFSDLKYVFDAQKLEEFTLPVDALSHKYEIINKRETFYDKHRGFIEFVFAISPFLVFLILGLIHNIYMRKRVEKDLRQRMEFDKVLLNSIEDPIFWQDETGNIVDANRKFCMMIKTPYEKIHGKSLDDLEANRNINKIIKVLEKYKRNQEENYEFRYFDEALKKVIYIVKQERFEDTKTNRTGTVTVFTNITKEKEIAKEKQRNRQFIIQQSKLAEIGEVFSSIAHQWKSPLVEITAIAQELFYTKKAVDSKEDDSFVKDIMQQVHYMTNTINDFQNFIMPSNKKVHFDVQESIEAMLQIVQHNMKYNNIKITLNVDENIDLDILGYKNEFMQSILNIINNAKDALLEKDYKNRKIEISIFKQDALVITIHDNAGGIDEKSIHKVFRPYFSTKEEGHGIGLYMTKMIIEDKMGGKISVKNRNDGALFTIKLEQ